MADKKLESYGVYIIVKSGSGKYGVLDKITSVLAYSHDDAAAKAEDTLNRPGRYHYYERWVDDGRIVQKLD
jgi:hypothetical protein